MASVLPSAPTGRTYDRKRSDHVLSRLAGRGPSTYDPLSGHLRRQRQDELELTFAEIERILGAMLPKSAARQQWWANTTDPYTSQVQRKAWGDAGYDAFLIAGKDRVRFKRVR